MPFQLRKKLFFQKLLPHGTYCNLQNQFQFTLLYFIFYLLSHLLFFNFDLQKNFTYFIAESPNNLERDDIFWMLNKMQFLNYYKFHYHILHFLLYTQYIDHLDSSFDLIINLNQIKNYPKILDQTLQFFNVSFIFNFLFFCLIQFIHHFHLTP